ncbi:hypothetical protein PUMCH_000885 [Australozyma saopauloensis]|uniref:J domain-containing protein n=1 Tax=Australozyma saopauloensis TaxID=291208 RepID=A0AAX4H5C3_9ASCO|nr:hypothetical protein PUMCH_000885 [[Candida] saopauloensis]
MVLPIVIGVAATVAALTGKAVAKSVARYGKLSPQMIASLNKIRLETHLLDGPSKVDPNLAHIRYLRSRFNNSGFPKVMTEREALLVLGIEASDIGKLDKTLLRQRYRALMVLNHPDRSGSVYLSQKINEAKDVLEKSYLFKK